MTLKRGYGEISALQAKFEAQKIVFGPLAFQAAYALRELGLLRRVAEAGEGGLSRREAADLAGISPYAAGVLMDMGLVMGLFRPADSGETGETGAGGSGVEERLRLAKVGWFLLEDELTKVNFDFVQDVCYQGAQSLADSARSGRPEGLAVFGQGWRSIYEALSSLPERAGKSWFAFDHYYSDLAFPEVLPLVFSPPPKRLFDLGGNTARLALACCAFDPEVEVTIIDLPGQIRVAEQKAAEAGLSGRIRCRPCDILDPESVFPEGAEVVWMSQFLDCFSLEQITGILAKIRRSVEPGARIYVLEPLLDKQFYPAAEYSLHAVSLYFTCMANGQSRMYRGGELVPAVEKGGFKLQEAWHGLGDNQYSLLCFGKV
ncbi:MAG: SAM-dependent methyltransferase [Desulfovibrionaceae bacterium]|nr:SAM-dependent methyltransferase [Desulfovibrionaceae bacterium]